MMGLRSLVRSQVGGSRRVGVYWQRVMQVRSMSAEPKEMMVGERSEVTGELTLYKGPSGITIPMMFGVGVFNTFYWSVALADHYIIKADFSMLGEYPTIGVAGLFGTGLIFGATYNYAHHYVARAYESGDGKRIGFQFHTMTGKLGRKIEVSRENAEALDVDSMRNRNALVRSMMGAAVPVNVKGLNFNVLLDTEGEFDEDGRLMDLLNKRL